MRPILLALLLLLQTTAAAAQPAPVELSLADALRLAEQHNPQYRKALHDLEAAEAAERRGWMALLPSLSLNLSTGGYLSRTFSGTDPFGKPVSRADPLEYEGSSSSQGISLGDLTLFDGGRRAGEMQATRAQGDAARAAVRAEAAALRGRLARAYFDARRFADHIEVEEELLRSARAQMEATRRLLRVAAASPVDLLGSEVEVSRQEQALERARGEARRAVLLLAELVGVEAPPAWRLTTGAPPLFDPVTLDVDALAERALRSGARVAQAEARAVAAERRRRVAGASRWPSVGAYASASRGMGREGYEALFEPNPLDQRVSFGLSVSVPLFQRGETATRVAQARAAERSADADLLAARLAVAREIRVAYLDLENAYRAARLAAQLRDLARRRLELAGEQFRVGSLRFVELQSILADAARAERELVNARFDFASALAVLEEKVEAPVAPPAQP